MVFRTGVALIRADVVRATLARLFSGGAIKGKASAALGSNVERFCDRPDIIARNVAKLAHASKHEQSKPRKLFRTLSYVHNVVLYQLYCLIFT